MGGGGRGGGGGDTAVGRGGASVARAAGRRWLGRASGGGVATEVTGDCTVIREGRWHGEAAGAVDCWLRGRGRG